MSANPRSRRTVVALLVTAALVATSVSAAVADPSADRSGPSEGSGASVQGTITDALGDPIQHSCAELYRTSGSGWSYDRRECTDVNGHYAILDVPEGTYRLMFRSGDPDSASEWWLDGDDIESATDLVIAAHSAYTRGASLSPASTLEGHVFGPGGEPQSTAYAQLYQWTPQYWKKLGGVHTDTGGVYRHTQIQPGRYKIAYLTGTDSELSEWWNDAPSMESATEVVIGRDQHLTGYDVTLRPAASISGQVTATDGSPVPGPNVFVYRLVDGEWVDETLVRGDNDGQFHIAYLEPGPRRLRFSDDPSNGLRGFVTEYWQDATTLEDATDIPLALGQVVTGINASVVLDPLPSVGNDVPPGVSGTPQVGSQLASFEGRWYPGYDMTYDFQWLADGEDLPGAVASTYVLTPAEEGKKMSIRVTAGHPGWTSTSVTSTETSPVIKGTLTNLAMPTFTGRAKVGELLTASPGSWAPAAEAQTYRWVVGGVSLGSGPTFRVPPVAAGHDVLVIVKASRAGYGSSTSSSTGKTVAPGTVAVVQKPALKGKAKVGKTLTALPGSYAPSGATSRIDWLVNGRVTPRHGTTFALRRRHLGSEIVVRVLVTTDGYDALLVRSAGKTVR